MTNGGYTDSQEHENRRACEEIANELAIRCIQREPGRRDGGGVRAGSIGPAGRRQCQSERPCSGLKPASPAPTEIRTRTIIPGRPLGECVGIDDTSKYQEVDTPQGGADGQSNGNFIPEDGTVALTLPNDEAVFGPDSTAIVVTFTTQSPVDGTVLVSVNGAESFEFQTALAVDKSSE